MLCFVLYLFDMPPTEKRDLRQVNITTYQGWVQIHILKSNTNTGQPNQPHRNRYAVHADDKLQSAAM